MTVKGKFKNLDLYSDAELAGWTLAGYTGFGTERKTFLGKRYLAVQNIVNKVLKDAEIPYGGSRPDYESLEKAVRSVYAQASEELIKAIEKENEK